MTTADLYKSTLGKSIDMPEFMSRQGHIPGISVNNRFGRNDDIGSIFQPVTMGGVYRTPQVSGATKLRIKAGGDAADTAAGTGARVILLSGLDATGLQITEQIVTAGASASLETTNTFFRLLSASVLESGTYGTVSPIVSSHAASIIIENSAGTEDWLTIDDTEGLGRALSEVGCFTVPLGKVGFIPSILVSVDSTKVADVLLFSRQNAIQESPPYSSVTMLGELSSISGAETVLPWAPFGPFPPLTDIGILAKISVGSAELDVHFEVILIDE